MADKGWSREFDEPISLPDGRSLTTLRDAADYITGLPKKEAAAPEWQAAIERVSAPSKKRAKAYRVISTRQPSWRSRSRFRSRAAIMSRTATIAAHSPKPATPIMKNVASFIGQDPSGPAFER